MKTLTFNHSKLLFLNFLLLVLIFPFWGFSQTPEVVITTGHAQLVSQVDVSPNGDFVASCSNTHIVKIWDIKTEKEISALNNHTEGVENEERINTMRFLQKGLSLVTADENGKISVWDIKTEKILKTYKTGVALPGYAFDISKNKLVFFGELASLTIVDLDKNDTQKVFENVKGRLAKINPANSNQIFIVDLKNQFKIFDIEKQEFILEFENTAPHIFQVAISPNGKYLAVIADQKLRVWNFKTGKILKTFDYTNPISIAFNSQTNELAVLHRSKDYIHSQISIIGKNLKPKRVLQDAGQYSTFISISHNGNYIAVNSMVMVQSASQNAIELIDWKTGETAKLLRSRAKSIWQISASKNTPRVATLTSDLHLRIWNLAEQTIEKVVPATQRIAENVDGSVLAMQSFQGGSKNYTAVVLWNLDSMKYISELPISDLLSDMKFCADNKHLITCNLQGKVSLWNIKQKKEVHTIELQKSGVHVADVSSDLKFIATSSLGKSSITIHKLDDGTSFTLENSHDLLGASTLKFSSDGKYLISGSYDTKVHIWETQNWTQIHNLTQNESSVSSVAFSFDNKFFAAATEGSAVKVSDYGINVWNTETGEQVCKLLGHQAGVKDVAFGGKNNLLYSAGEDGSLRIWDLKNCKEIAACISIDYGDYIFVTPDNYYTGSQNALKGVGFKLDGVTLYPFEQFDLRLNRPDIIAKRINLASEKLIKAFEKAYEKRIDKMGYNQTDFNNDFNLPEIKIANRNEFDFKVEKNKIKLKIIAEDAKYQLDRINIWVNNIPIFSRSGISVANLETQKIEKEIEIKLSEGKNIIQVSVLNIKGVESLKETIELIAPQSEKNHDLYLLTIGVSDYQDNSLDLNYAAKDATDLAKLFENEAKLFDKVNVISILDTNATKEAIFETRKILEKTDINDMVIVFFAGHGLISMDWEYFFATTDVDSYEPEKRGFSYDDLDRLIDSIPARQKLIMVDACHSGEIDVEEYFNKREEVNENVFVRGVESSQSAYQRVGLNNSFSLMKELFSDLRRGTGAIIISSAGGAEYAYESGKYKNGIFTHVLKNALETMEADTNEDGKISVNELKEYVPEEVSKLTKGRQNPTIRRENTNYNFFVW